MSILQGLKGHVDVWRRAAILALVLIALVVVATSAPFHDLLLKVLSESRDVIKHYPAAGAFLFVGCAALSAMLAFVSVAVIVPIAVFTWGAPLSMALLWLGWILGGALSYAIGHAFGRPIIDRLVSKNSLRKFESKIRNDMPFAAVLLFQAALPSEIPGYLLGIVRYRFTKYLLALSIAELPYTVATVYLGESVIASRGGAIFLIGVGLIAASAGVFYLFRRQTD